MALLMVQEGIQPAGQYALDDGYAPLGGEVYVLTASGVDSDGYKTLVASGVGEAGQPGPYYLSDDGLKGYGVLFGVTVARTSTGFTDGADVGNRLGPASYFASGNVTLWDKPGLYAVTLDALDPAISTATWAGLNPGAKLTVLALGTGQITTGGTSSNPALTAVTFKLDESLVTTGGSVMDKQKLVIRFNPFGTL